MRTSKPEIPEIYTPDPTLKEDRREVTSESVVFLGDSLTHIAIWKELFPDVKTSNQGIGGNTTAMILERLQPIIDLNPEKIFLLIGANDLNFGVPLPVITEGQRQIIHRITEGSPDTKLYVQSIFPFGGKCREFFPTIPKTFKQDIKELNNALRLLCLIYDVTYLDVHNNVMANSKGYMKKEFTKDQIHLEKEGYIAWRNYLEKFVKE